MAPLGHLIRLNPFHIDELPAHPAFESSVGTPEHDASNGNGHAKQVNDRPNLLVFVEEVLKEARLFIDTTMPDTFKSKGSKSSAPSVAKVELLQRMISPSQIPRVPRQNSTVSRPLSLTKSKTTGEAWFARRSRHANLSVRNH